MRAQSCIVMATLMATPTEWGHMNTDCTVCGAILLEASEDMHYDWHKSLEPNGFEWACQWKTFLDGDYDRMISHHPLSNKPLTEDEAREEVQSMLAAKIPARLLRRGVSEWAAT